jgi:protein-tyrosine phosphatase
MPSILFVCRANQFRSPLAAACMLREIKKLSIPGKWAVDSAGTWTNPGNRIPPSVLQIFHRLGLLGLSRHRTRQLTQTLADNSNLIIVMEFNQKEAILAEFPNVNKRVFILSEICEGIAYDIPDPALHGVDPEKVAAEILKLIKIGAGQISRTAQTLSEQESV